MFYFVRVYAQISMDRLRAQNEHKVERKKEKWVRLDMNNSFIFCVHRIDILSLIHDFDSFLFPFCRHLNSKYL